MFDRRDLLGVLAVAAFGTRVSAHQMAGMTEALAKTAPKVTPFAAPRHLTLDRLVELIIPTTDTGGAKAAGVTVFIELLYEHWMNDTERQRCDVELALAADAFSMPGDPVANLYSNGKFKMPTLRKLTIYGYYTSEIGASEELDLNLIPGSYDACSGFVAGDRAPSLNTWGIMLSLTPLGTS